VTDARFVAITTARLSLDLVPLAALTSTARRDVPETCRLLNATLNPEWFEDDWVYAQRAAQCQAEPGFAPWSIRAIRLKATGEVVGHINFHHQPMPFRLADETLTAAEMGYTIFTPYRRNGYGFEAVTTLLTWARQQGVAAALLTIDPANTASLALAARLDARLLGPCGTTPEDPEQLFLIRC
jgi:RimJ/RimL family protein N-acetyltransferase